MGIGQRSHAILMVGTSFGEVDSMSALRSIVPVGLQDQCFANGYLDKSKLRNASGARMKATCPQPTM